MTQAIQNFKQAYAEIKEIREELLASLPLHNYKLNYLGKAILDLDYEKVKAHFHEKLIGTLDEKEIELNMTPLYLLFHTKKDLVKNADAFNNCLSLFIDSCDIVKNDRLLEPEEKGFFFSLLIKKPEFLNTVLQKSSKLRSNIMAYMLDNNSYIEKKLPAYCCADFFVASPECLNLMCKHLGQEKKYYEHLLDVLISSSKPEQLVKIINIFPISDTEKLLELTAQKLNMKLQQNKLSAKQIQKIFVACPELLPLCLKNVDSAKIEDIFFNHLFPIDFSGTEDIFCNDYKKYQGYKLMFRQCKMFEAQKNYDKRKEEEFLSVTKNYYSYYGIEDNDYVPLQDPYFYKTELAYRENRLKNNPSKLSTPIFDSILSTDELLGTYLIRNINKNEHIDSEYKIELIEVIVKNMDNKQSVLSEIDTFKEDYWNKKDGFFSSTPLDKLKKEIKKEKSETTMTFM